MYGGRQPVAKGGRGAKKGSHKTHANKISEKLEPISLRDDEDDDDDYDLGETNNMSNISSRCHLTIYDWGTTVPHTISNQHALMFTAEPLQLHLRSIPRWRLPLE